jgi:hypothetical protein
MTREKVGIWVCKADKSTRGKSEETLTRRKEVRGKGEGIK